jgi:hypothetical protein
VLSSLHTLPTHPQTPTPTDTNLLEQQSSINHVPPCELVLRRAVPTPLSAYDHGRRPAILCPSEDHIHGLGCPCNGSTNPTAHCHGTTFCTGAHPRGVYSRIPPRSHVLNHRSAEYKINLRFLNLPLVDVDGNQVVHATQPTQAVAWPACKR